MTSGTSASDDRPIHWDKRVAAAYLRMLGATQKETAESVGRSERTIWGWEQEPNWADARREASERWMAETTDAARKSVLSGIRGGNADLGFRFLERVDDRLAPPKQRHEHGGEGGGPIEVAVTHEIIDPSEN